MCILRESERQRENWFRNALYTRTVTTPCNRTATDHYVNCIRSVRFEQDGFVWPSRTVLWSPARTYANNDDDDERSGNRGRLSVRATNRRRDERSCHTSSPAPHGRVAEASGVFSIFSGGGSTVYT
jgi:hypothetical protein